MTAFSQVSFNNFTGPIFYVLVVHFSGTLQLSFLYFTCIRAVVEHAVFQHFTNSWTSRAHTSLLTTREVMEIQSSCRHPDVNSSTWDPRISIILFPGIWRRGQADCPESWGPRFRIIVPLMPPTTFTTVLPSFCHYQMGRPFL